MRQPIISIDWLLCLHIYVYWNELNSSKRERKREKESEKKKENVCLDSCQKLPLFFFPVFSKQNAKMEQQVLQNTIITKEKKGKSHTNEYVGTPKKSWSNKVFSILCGVDSFYQIKKNVDI